MERRLASPWIFILTLLLQALQVQAIAEPTSDTYRSNQGPLTTQFVPPSTCLSEVRTRFQFGYPAFELGCEGPAGDQCCPTGWGWYRYFSPEVCPVGYRTCALPSSEQREETTKLCCPSDYDCPNHVDRDCSQWLNTASTSTYEFEGKTSTETIRQVYATNIQIRYQASDSAVVPVPTENDVPPPSKSMSAGKAVGITIGVLACMICLTTAIWLSVYRWRQKQARDNAGGAGAGVGNTDGNTHGNYSYGNTYQNIPGDGNSDVNLSDAPRPFDDPPPAYPGPKQL